MPGFTKIYHRSLGADDYLSVDSAGSQLVLLPAPMDHDACFRDAGFVDFGDSDDAWDTDFGHLLDAVLAVDDTPLPIRLVDDYSHLLGEACTPREALLLATQEDSFPPAEVVLGDPPQVRIVIGDSHQAIWIGHSSTSTLLRDSLLRRLAQKWRLAATDIDVAHLIPRRKEPAH